MDIELNARGASITDRFRGYAEEKLTKVSQLLPKATNIAVKLSRHSNPHANTSGGKVEITVLGPGDVIRAEAEGPDKYIAFDAAYHRVMERARRVHDKRSDKRGRSRTSLREASEQSFAGLGVAPADGAVIEAVATGTVAVQEADGDEQEWSPVVIREKHFAATPMSVREAVDQMELVGHPFYLFIEAESGERAVVYRRKGWSYGVIRLDEEGAEA